MQLILYQKSTRATNKPECQSENQKYLPKINWIMLIGRKSKIQALVYFLFFQGLRRRLLHGPVLALRDFLGLVGYSRARITRTKKHYRQRRKWVLYPRQCRQYLLKILSAYRVANEKLSATSAKCSETWILCVDIRPPILWMQQRYRVKPAPRMSWACHLVSARVRWVKISIFFVVPRVAVNSHDTTVLFVNFLIGKLLLFTLHNA